LPILKTPTARAPILLDPVMAALQTRLSKLEFKGGSDASVMAYVAKLDKIFESNAVSEGEFLRLVGQSLSGDA
jgi:hypothetical protein